MSYPTGINATVSLLSSLPNVTVKVNTSNVTVSNIPVLQTGLPNLINIIDSELDKKAVISGDFSISGAGNIVVSVVGNTIIISGIN